MTEDIAALQALPELEPISPQFGAPDRYFCQFISCIITDT